MTYISFKERVRNIVIREAITYKKNLINYEYLICSKAFTANDYYIVAAKEENYLHLTGVNSNLKPIDFFNKCLNGTLQDTDFDFVKPRQSEKDVKGTVRRKIKVLPLMNQIFNQNSINVEENFVKNKITCSFATCDGACTIGFANTSKSHPKSLMSGNELSPSKSKQVALILRKRHGKDKFDEIIIGDDKTLFENHTVIIEELSSELIHICKKYFDASHSKIHTTYNTR